MTPLGRGFPENPRQLPGSNADSFIFYVSMKPTLTQAARGRSTDMLAWAAEPGARAGLFAAKPAERTVLTIKQLR